MCIFWLFSVVVLFGFLGEDFCFRFMGDEGLIDLNLFGDLKIVCGGKWEIVY